MSERGGGLGKVKRREGDINMSARGARAKKNQTTRERYKYGCKRG